MSAVRIPVIGIVGGIGSGKSTVTAALAQHFRCVRLDADAAGHKALKLPEVKNQLRQVFGEDVFDSHGEISRPQIASRVFGDAPAQQQARQRLEQIVHPVIRAEIYAELKQHQTGRDCDLILLDAALLLESGWAEVCDAVVFIETPLEQRQQRVASRGWDAAELKRREASQMDLQEKRRRADLEIDNSRSVENAATQLANWLKTRFFPTQSPTSQYPLNSKSELN
ncbi:dephospho-CoA kinase [Planctomicrobium sp. SH664]|uniref:dephospho-CoA kinase n=1 Tax=Planctomicrobium sp. SH664 TaxID=3448125 RepID=UPI003F5C1928